MFIIVFLTMNIINQYYPDDENNDKISQSISISLAHFLLLNSFCFPGVYEVFHYIYLWTKVSECVDCVVLRRYRMNCLKNDDDDDKRGRKLRKTVPEAFGLDSNVKYEAQSFFFLLKEWISYLKVMILLEDDDDDGDDHKDEE